jgi:predicted methyltransferase
MARRPATTTPAPPRTRQTVVLSLITLCLLGTTTVAQQRGWQRRDRWQNPEGIIEALQAREGSWIADIGAGNGYLTHHLARAVGPQGRVFAVDIDEDVLGSLRNGLPDEMTDRVTTIEGTIESPLLPTDAIDGVVMLNAYHEMTEYESMLANVRESLKVGGLLVIADRATASDSTRTRRRQIGSHRLHYRHVREELVNAGFEIVSLVEEFALDPGGRNRAPYWLLVARRPAT